MESAVETLDSPPTVTQNTNIRKPELDITTTLSEKDKPNKSSVEVASPSAVVLNNEKPSPAVQKDPSIVRESKKTKTSSVETGDNDDVTIVSESKKPTTAKLAVETVENASIISESSSHEGHRLWIGNIDPKITEYHLVKLLERFGKVRQFDFLFHKSGPMEGQPRGYCFVNFHTKEEAERAIHCLNGKLALSKKLVVRWAHAQVKRFEGFRGDKNGPASLEPSCSAELDLPTNLSTSAKIRAIEAKLQMMEDNPDEEYQGPSAYMYNKPPEKKRPQPYSRPFRRFRR
ncbi:hypothetical protein DPEC_G00333350 [Dallia pectoralis]|uniref:Uncharacterized protein n=1 Tax=Dallia pectoralis TaxID=75939 RepID=A0ACC2F697_DALPE|nr:hypothetical protein DPEC_G00333350 [Dallia pectoralis]